MIHIMIVATWGQNKVSDYALKNCMTNPTDTKHSCHSVSHTLFDSLTFWTDFWAVIQRSPAQLSMLITQEKNEKAATLESLYYLKANKKLHYFPDMVLLTLPCCDHNIGICSLFTALMTGFKHTSLKSELTVKFSAHATLSQGAVFIVLIFQRFL